MVFKAHHQILTLDKARHSGGSHSPVFLLTNNPPLIPWHTYRPFVAHHCRTLLFSTIMLKVEMQRKQTQSCGFTYQWLKSTPSPIATFWNLTDRLKENFYKTMPPKVITSRHHRRLTQEVVVNIAVKSSRTNQVGLVIIPEFNLDPSID